MPFDTHMPLAPTLGAAGGASGDVGAAAGGSGPGIPALAGQGGALAGAGSGPMGGLPPAAGAGGDTAFGGGGSGAGRGGSAGASGSAGLSSSGGGGGGAAGSPVDRCVVQPLTDEFRSNYDDLDPFYRKYADANGLPVVSSDAPSDMALVRACELVIDMTMRDDVREALIDNYVRFAIIGKDELTNDIPEFSYLPDSINQRARGLGGIPAVSCAEESILCDTALDRWRGEGICVHEFAHTISMAGLFYADRSFEGRLDDAYRNAQSSGLFQNTYAMESSQEYWAEGVQDWYYTNLESDPPNGIHNHIDRREELAEYDPALYDLIAELLPEPVQFVDCYSDE